MRLALVFSLALSACMGRVGFEDSTRGVVDPGTGGDAATTISGDATTGDSAIPGDPAGGDDAQVRVRFTTTTINIEEGNADEVFVEVVPPTAVNVTFEVIREPTVSGVADPTDYGIMGSPVAVTSATPIGLTTTNDDHYEGTETFRVELTSTDVGIVDSPSVVTVTITDDDLPPTLTMCTDTATRSVEGTVVDSGGTSGNYSDNESCLLEIRPGRGVTLTFSEIALESCCDSLTVFDGPSLLAALDGSSVPGTLVAPRGELRLVFQSDGSVNDTGFVASWTSATVDDSPDPIELDDIVNADPGIWYQSQTAVTGFDGPLTATGSGLQLGGSPWGATAEVYPGDLLDVRILSPSSTDEQATGTLALGTAVTAWTVRTGPPLCAGALGTACATGSTGSAGTPLNAGEADDVPLMVTPGGCADVDGGTVIDYARRELVPSAAFTPSCPGTEDIVVKDWTAGFTTEDRGAISPFDGPDNTLILAGEPNGGISKTSTGVHPAAEYCAWLDYGGYDDWYLPSTRELAQLYCLSNAGGSHNASNPLIDADCASLGGGGPNGALTGFSANSVYATSTEANANVPWQIDMRSGYIDDYGGKSDAYRVRCVRRAQ